MAVDSLDLRRHAAERNLLAPFWVMPLLAGFAVILVAAGMLTETVMVANQIDTNAAAIAAAAGGIQSNTSGVPVLDQVDATAKQIKVAADPLNGQANTILATVDQIDATVGQIDSTTGSIDAQASSIQGTVTSIAPHVLAIAEPAERINSKLQAAIDRLNAILAVVASAKNDTGFVLATPVPEIETHACSIDQAVNRTRGISCP